MKKINAIVTATLTSSIIVGCSSYAKYRPITDDTFNSKPINCDIPISREPLKENQRQVGELTVTRGGIASNVRSNVAEQEAKSLIRKEACQNGIDGVAEFKELRIEHSAQDIQWEGKGYVEEN